ncbi:hypothetical protein HYFRA_00010273 [Hymenoscyphus fraxineus]|uniref:Glucose-methanol-choline oxidoreductase N-terminal domain-containing protein n=1 Tax=Hymenoscyphus fraxineus TaxID=746836 RepID=A0A9N9KWZ1_9HELO|nr:hypothetical protein HYFRA_00010273 [Hymenoscyphus fraxineus]
MSATFDFIIVGAGASGCVVASRIADTGSHPSILLIEAGGSNKNVAQLSGEERFEVAFSPNSPLNWNYKTVPQNHLTGQEIDYSRGKGLGGSTAINFCGWAVGPRDDYDEWARIVKDDAFKWYNAKRCLRKIENFHPEISIPELKKYIDPNIGDHGDSGMIDLTYGDSWIPDVGDIFKAIEESGLRTNKDINSGDPIGMGMSNVCIHKGERITSASSYLANKPTNLEILTDSGVTRIIFESKRAIGVQTIDGKTILARKEVIVSGGALNTPQILMLSGVGPAEELERHGIQSVHELPMLGKTLQDHCFSSVGVVMKAKSRDQIQPHLQNPTPMGWFKLPSVQESNEYRALPLPKRQFLQATTVPSIELATHIPPSLASYEMSPDTRFLGAMCLLMNPQSLGTVTLQSADPNIAPKIDPQFLTHGYDRRVMIEGVRETMRVLSAPVYAVDTIDKVGPTDDSDEEIWKHIRGNLSSSWHMSCTARMGTSIDSACVDSSFRIFGLQSCRVIDLSVCPFVPNNHTQSTAYVIAEMAAEKLIAEYDLQSRREGSMKLVTKL